MVGGGQARRETARGRLAPDGMKRGDRNAGVGVGNVCWNVKKQNAKRSRLTGIQGTERSTEAVVKGKAKSPEKRAKQIQNARTAQKPKKDV